MLRNKSTLSILVAALASGAAWAAVAAPAPAEVIRNAEQVVFQGDGQTVRITIQNLGPYPLVILRNHVADANRLSPKNTEVIVTSGTVGLETPRSWMVSNAVVTIK